MAGELGLEPRMTVPKTAVLPLHHGTWIAIASANVVYILFIANFSKKNIKKLISTLLITKK